MKYNKKGESRIEISDILNYFKDINSMYNDCLRHDSLKRMLEDLVAETREDVELECKTGKWIPCSERLPGESGRYLITVLDGIGRRTTVAPYQPRYKAWTMTGRMAYWKVIAWMPLPNPYKKESGGK